MADNGFEILRAGGIGSEKLGRSVERGDLAHAGFTIFAVSSDNESVRTGLGEGFSKGASQHTGSTDDDSRRTGEAEQLFQVSLLSHDASYLL